MSKVIVDALAKGEPVDVEVSVTIRVGVGDHFEDMMIRTSATSLPRDRQGMEVYERHIGRVASETAERAARDIVTRFADQYRRDVSSSPA